MKPHSCMATQAPSKASVSIPNSPTHVHGGHANLTTFPIPMSHTPMHIRIFLPPFLSLHHMPPKPITHISFFIPSYPISLPMHIITFTHPPLPFSHYPRLCFMYPFHIHGHYHTFHAHLHTHVTYPHLTTPPKPVSLSKPSHFSHHLFSLYPTYPSCTVFSLIYTTSYHQPHAYTIISSMPHPLNPTPSNSSPIRSRYFPLAWISTRVGILVSLHPPTIILIPYSIYHTTCPLNLSHYLLAPITIFFQNTHSPVSLTTVIFINESSP